MNTQTMPNNLSMSINQNILALTNPELFRKTMEHKEHRAVTEELFSGMVRINTLWRAIKVVEKDNIIALLRQAAEAAGIIIATVNEHLSSYEIRPQYRERALQLAVTIVKAEIELRKGDGLHQEDIELFAANATLIALTELAAYNDLYPQPALSEKTCLTIQI